MAEEKKPEKSVMTIVEEAFPEAMAPPDLSVSIVSLVELCKEAMPDPALVHKAIEGAGFVVEIPEKAQRYGDWLALDNKVFSFPVRNIRHKLYARERSNALVAFLISEGDSAHGKVIFCTAVFWGAIEADAVKAAAHVTKKPPLTGAKVKNAEGDTLRRVFWDTAGLAGIRGLMVTGPDNVEAHYHGRAFTAFNIAGRKK